MIKFSSTLLTLVFSLVLISCGGGSGSSSSASNVSSEVYQAFFTEGRAQAIEAARSLGVDDTSLDGLWLAFLLDEQPDGPGKDMDDYRIVFEIKETVDDVTFIPCKGNTGSSTIKVPKDANGNIQVPGDMFFFYLGKASAPIYVPLISNTEIDFGSWNSGYGTDISLTAIKIRNDASSPVGTITDGIKSIDLYCFDYSNHTETSDGFKTQNGNRKIEAEESGYKFRCNADAEVNEEIYGSIFRPDSSFATFDSEVGDSIDFHVSENTLTYSCTMNNGIDSAKISYDLK